MVTAVDSSILLDVLANDPAHASRSLALLRDARSLGALIVCPVVWAEVRAFFEDAVMMAGHFDRAALLFDPIDRQAADLAGALWRGYRRRGGRRDRLIPDFLVGAHAQVRCGRLLTRDRGFYRRYFEDLQVLG